MVKHLSSDYVMGRVWVILLLMIVACHEPIQSVVESHYQTGATGAIGETGVSGTDGLTGETGTPGSAGETGVTGLDGPTGETDCLNSTPPDFSVEISPGPVEVGKTYTITLNRNSTAFSPTSYNYGLDGAGGTLSPNGNAFAFIPVMCGGPYHFTAWVKDPCHTAIKDFTIDYINPGWLGLGDVGGIADSTSNIALIVSDGTPYVAFNSSQYIEIKHYNGERWVDIPGLGVGGSDLSIFSHDRFLYLAYFMGNLNQVRFKKYGSIWSEFLPYAGLSFSPSIFVFNGTPYVTYQDGTNTQVAFFNGSALEKISEFVSDDSSFAPLSVWNGTVYVAYRQIERLYLKINEAAPLDLNQNGILFPHSLFVENGTPYVAYTNNTFGPCSVMKNGSTGFEFIGSQYVSNNSYATNISLSVYQGTPYAAFEVTIPSTSPGIWLYKYTGGGTSGWEPLIGPLNGTYPGFYLYHGTPYLAYQDNGSVFVKKYIGCD